MAARAKGLSETRVIWAMRCATPLSPARYRHRGFYAGLLEARSRLTVFSQWPGIGLYITNSLQNADMNAVLGGTIVIGTVFIGINLLSDLLYRTSTCDPDLMSMQANITRPMTRREWLLSDRPQSRTQARPRLRLRHLAAVYRQTALRLLASSIIIALLLMAAFADVLATHSPVVGDLRNARLLPPGTEGYLPRYRRPGPRHLLAPDLRLPPDADGRRPRRRHLRADRPPGRHGISYAGGRVDAV